MIYLIQFTKLERIIYNSLCHLQLKEQHRDKKKKKLYKQTLQKSNEALYSSLAYRLPNVGFGSRAGHLSISMER